MSEKYIKIQSQQNAPFNASNNRVDWIIPSSFGKVSMKDSFIQMYCKVDAVEADSATGTGVYMSALKWNNGGNPYNNHFDNVALIRNSRISSANKGMIESVRRTDILRQNLTSMRQSQSEVDSLRYITADPLKNLKNGQQYGFFTDVNKSGDVFSTSNDNTPVMVRLGDILDFCNVDVIDMAKMGDTRIHTELNIENISATQVFPDVLTNGDKVDDIAQPSQDTPISSLTTTTKYTNLDQSPWYVGQKIEYTGTVNGAGNTTANGVIISILQNANGSLTLRLNRDLFTLTSGNGGATGGTLDIIAPTSLTPEFHRMELVLKVVPQSTPDASNVLYTQFDTYELNGLGATNFTNVVEIHGGAENAIIMPVNVNGLDSTGSITDFRIALNNVELTDSRSVIPYTPLYQDRVVAGLGKADYVVKSLQNSIYDNSLDTLYSASQTSTIVMPLFETVSRKNLQININSSGLNAFVLYTSVPRTIEL